MNCRQIESIKNEQLGSVSPPLARLRKASRTDMENDSIRRFLHTRSDSSRLLARTSFSRFLGRAVCGSWKLKTTDGFMRDSAANGADDFLRKGKE